MQRSGAHHTMLFWNLPRGFPRGLRIDRLNPPVRNDVKAIYDAKAIYNVHNIYVWYICMGIFSLLKKKYIYKFYFKR